jgi:hypothetical protein
MVRQASQTVGKAMRKGAIVVYESTVYPGATEEECIPILESYSGRYPRFFTRSASTRLMYSLPPAPNGIFYPLLLV